MVKFRFPLLALLIAALSMPFTDAEAKRLGSGRSFGGKPSYSVPYQRAQIPLKLPQPAQAATPIPREAHSPLPKRSSPLGWLAPFLVGGLLGALLLGGPFQHLTLADLLVFAGLAFFLFNLLARRRQPEEVPHPAEGISAKASPRPFDTDLLFHPSGDLREETESSLTPMVPAAFDLKGFLEQAKAIFRQLQSAWSQTDLAEIRGLTTDEAFMEIKAQKEAGLSGPVEVLALEADLLDYRETADEEMAAVLFTATLAEDGQAPEQIEEIWHFVRTKSAFRPIWRLDGIQQIA
jgi:predicted lipid-binding transport protein (Tim44 family)